MKRSAQLALDALRRIDADMLDVAGLQFEDQPVPDFTPTLKAFSRRISEAADGLELELQLAERDEKDARRWDFLFREDGMEFVQRADEQWRVSRKIYDSQRNLIGTQLIGVGPDLAAIIDKHLGIK